MSDEKHSPGPWRWGDGGNIYAAGRPAAIAMVPVGGSIHDARIIAAAPEMLALLRKVAECEADDITLVLPFELQDSVRDLLDRIDGKEGT